MADDKKSKKRIIFVLYFLILSGMAAAGFFCYGLIRELRHREEGRAYYDSLPSVSVSVIKPLPVKEEPIPEGWPSRYIPAVPEPSSEPIVSVWSVDFDALREVIPAAAAWIKIDGTAVDYPVVQGSDNDYYLRRLPDGASNPMGSIFLDYRNAVDFSDNNSIIYGHHLKTGEMFSALENYKEQSYYDEHPVISLYTPGDKLEIELLGGYVVSAIRETLPIDFESEAAFDRYVAEVRRRSVFASLVEIEPEDRLVSLCTCTYNFENARFILVGRIKKL